MIEAVVECHGPCKSGRGRKMGMPVKPTPAVKKMLICALHDSCPLALPNRTGCEMAKRMEPA